MTEAAVAVLGTMAASHLRGMRASSPHIKRDRKRQHLMERLSTMTEKLSRDRDATYRDQLQKVQADTNLVLRFDPYAPDVLDTIAELRREHSVSVSAAGLDPVASETARSLLEMSGPSFHDFLHEIEDLIEIRDFQLTEHKKEHERKIHEYKTAHTCHVETGKREHRALVSTLRDRLINTISSKKTRLSKEKEALEISDSTALLLHPNQFSIANPASPGGVHGKRATRLRKEVDELPGFSDGNKKRKRNPADEDCSPAPPRRLMDVSNTTPLWQSERLRAAAKQSGPIYDIDKLFTDKELTMAYNTAALASYRYILKNRKSAEGDVSSSPDGSDSRSDSNENGGEPEGSDHWPLVAPMMERQVSHATRSTRGSGAPNFVDNKIIGIEAIANLDSAANLDLLHSLEPPKMPPLVPQAYLKPYSRTADQHLVNPLPADEVASDIMMMDMFKQYDHARRPGSCLEAGTSLRKMLEAIAFASCETKYAGFVSTPRDDPESLRRELGLPMTTSKTRNGDHSTPVPQLDVPVIGTGVPMSRQSSAGGVAMSRQGTGNSSWGGKTRKAKEQ